MDENKFENGDDNINEEQNQSPVDSEDNSADHNIEMREIGIGDGDSSDIQGKKPYKWKAGIILAAAVIVVGFSYLAMHRNASNYKYTPQGGNNPINSVVNSPDNPSNRKSANATINPQNGSSGNIKANLAASPSAAPIATKLTAEAAMKIATDTAKKQFKTDSVFVVPASEGAVNIDIDGKTRACYLFGADSAGADMSKGMRGLYHVDGNTGEVFDNGSGNMVKVS